MAISTDTVYTHKIFAQVSPSAQKVQFPLISDSNHNISQLYNSLNLDSGSATRTTVIISPEGIVNYFSQYPNAVGRSTQEIIRIIKALQFNQKTQQGVPSDWQPEQGGIPTDWNMVGKV